MGGVPGPVIEAYEGDTVVVHVINDSPYDVTIHWYARTHVTEQPTMARPRAHDLNRNHRAAAGIITSRRVHAGTACSSGARRGRTARRW